LRLLAQAEGVGIIKEHRASGEDQTDAQKDLQ